MCEHATGKEKLRLVIENKERVRGKRLIDVTYEFINCL